MTDATSRIYLTYKTRMTTERRLRQNGFIVDALMNWYSLCLIVISVANLSKLFTIPYVDLHTTILSIALFGVSLFAYGQKYGDRAESFRSCYLELQELYNSTLPGSDKMTKYSEILSRYHNQSDDDYETMVVENHFRGARLENSTGPVTATPFMIVKVFSKTALRFLIVVFLFIGPPIVSAVWLKPISMSESVVPTDQSGQIK